jgi:hypothetical protein
MQQTDSIRALLRENPLMIDPSYRAECARLADNAGIRMRYFRADGVGIETFAEILYDRGITAEHLDCVATLELLEGVMVTSLARDKRPRGRKRTSKRETATAETKARKNRLRKFECPACHQIARGTRATDLICGRCYACDGELIALVRIDLLPEEILAAAANESERAA